MPVSRLFQKLFLLSLVVIFANLVFYCQVSADDSCNDPGSCANLINDIQKQLDAAKGQEKTLNSQLGIIDAQTKLTQARIADTNLQITKLENEITDLDGRIGKISITVDSLSAVLLSRIVQTYKHGDITPIDLLFSSKGFSDVLEGLKYIEVAQANDKKVLYQLQATKAAYKDQVNDKQTRQAQEKVLKQQLDVYQSQLDQQKTDKQKLLAETQGSEATYEKLLAQARAQLAGFSRFTGGRATILSNQTTCDGWGCYYNQRDSQWGNMGLNGSSYSLADDGCLVTSMAMVYTHYGHKDVTPISINSNSSNFSVVAPTFLKYTISANGTSSNRIGVAEGIIDSELSAGRPVIVGIGGGPDHFVVFVSGSSGSYQINDPFVPNGHNISFTDHYSLASISEIDKVNF